MLLIILFFPWIGCHFSALGLKNGISFRFLSPSVGLGFTNLRGTTLSKIRGCTRPCPGFKIKAAWGGTPYNGLYGEAAPERGTFLSFK